MTQPLNHKRPLLGSDQHDRDITLQPPRHDCYACNDTGIVSNGDGILSDYFPLYDHSLSGKPTGGSDCAVICQCRAAFPEQDQEGRVIRGGYRMDSGELRRIDTDQGPRYPGVDIPVSAVSEIHKRRRQAWIESCAELNRARQARASGTDPQALPWFLEELSDMLKQAKTAQAEREQTKRADQARRLESIGSILDNIAPGTGHDIPEGRGRYNFPEVIEGPIGFRPAWLTNKQEEPNDEP